ncbi:MAG: SCO family protein [Rhodocyclaceae bacterium]|jgi:protein SCO1/2|nr:SCO family protein [Rhodocyclaceae bacterium]
MKIAIAGLVVLMGAVFLWRPLSLPFSGAVVTNDFVLQTADGPLDTKALRGNVLAVVFATVDCGAPCAERAGRLARAYAQLNDGERASVRMVLISADPERDPPVRIGAYAKGIHPEMAGATGKPDEVQAVADGFAVLIKRNPPGMDGPPVAVSQWIYLVEPDGRYSSVLNDNVGVEAIAQSLRSRIPPRPSIGR